MRARVIGAALSLALHALLIAALVRTTAASAVPPPQHTAWVEPKEAPIQLRGNDSNGVELACAVKSYRGVGIVVSFTGTVISVGPNTPAEHAGLLAGDTIVNTEAFSDVYAPGAVVHLVVRRDGAQMAVSVPIGKICQD